MHHDGMVYFDRPRSEENPAHGLLALNHEYIGNGVLFKEGTANWDLDKTRKVKNTMGVSVIEVIKDNAGGQVVRPLSFSRRITANTSMQLSSPAHHKALMKTTADPQGEVVLGTIFMATA